MVAEGVVLPAAGAGETTRPGSDATETGGARELPLEPWEEWDGARLWDEHLLEDL